MKGKRVRDKQSGRIGTVTKVIGNCLWVRMDDDGTEWSGGKSYWAVIAEKKSEASASDFPDSGK